MKTFESEILCPSAHDVLFFVDDTGHETFAGDQGYYGLGGCVLLGAAYAHLKEAWAKVRYAINGSLDKPLHASSMERRRENFATLSNFFLDPAFLRVAVTTTRKVCLPPTMHPCVPVMGQLRKEVEFVTAVLRSKILWVIVESSQRADPVVANCFDQLASLDVLGIVSVKRFFMSKAANEAGLEIADFVVSAASSQVQRRLRGQHGFAPDFRDVFQRLPIDRCRYREVSNVEIDAGGLVSVSGNRLS